MPETDMKNRNVPNPPSKMDVMNLQSITIMLFSSIRRYEIPSATADRMRSRDDTYTFPVRSRSFFRSPCSRSISLYFETKMVLNRMTHKNMTPKQRMVAIAASEENTKENCLSVVLNSFAVRTDSPCDKKIPSRSPNARDMIPMNSVSRNKM